MPKYKVLEKGFYGGILREPGGRHDPVVTSKAIPKAKMPSWLEEIKPGKNNKASENKPNEDVANFLGEDETAEKSQADVDIETL